MFASGRKKLATPPRQGAGCSFVGADVVITGDLTAATQIHIDGRVEGNVRCESLIQGDGGTITGHIIADSAHLSGLVDGTVKARVITLESTARITGDVTYETLSMAAGAAIEGRLARKEGTPALEPAAPAALNLPVPEKKRSRSLRRDEPSLLPAIEPAAAPAPASASTG